MPDYDGLLDDDYYIHHNRNYNRKRNKYNVHSNLKKYRKNPNWTMVLLAVSPYDIDICDNSNQKGIMIIIIKLIYIIAKNI